MVDGVSHYILMKATPFLSCLNIYNSMNLYVVIFW